MTIHMYQIINMNLKSQVVMIIIKRFTIPERLLSNLMEISMKMDGKFANTQEVRQTGGGRIIRTSVGKGGNSNLPIIELDVSRGVIRIPMRMQFLFAWALRGSF